MLRVLTLMLDILLVRDVLDDLSVVLRAKAVVLVDSALNVHTRGRSNAVFPAVVGSKATVRVRGRSRGGGGRRRSGRRGRVISGVVADRALLIIAVLIGLIIAPSIWLAQGIAAVAHTRAADNVPSVAPNLMAVVMGMPRRLVMDDAEVSDIDLLVPLKRARDRARALGDTHNELRLLNSEL